MTAKFITLADANDAARYGNKAARLSLLHKAGLKMPEAYVIPAEYLDEIEESSLVKIFETIIDRFQNPELGYAIRLSPFGNAAGDSCLNIGYSGKKIDDLGKHIGEWSAYDSYRRFLVSWGDYTGLDIEEFEDILYDFKENYGVETDQDLDTSALIELCKAFETLTDDDAPIPENPAIQGVKILKGMLARTRGASASFVRQAQGYGFEYPCAVILQSMSFGNRQDNTDKVSGTGHAKTRSAKTGQRNFVGNFLPNAQRDEDRLGLRTPRMITQENREIANLRQPSLQETSAPVLASLTQAVETAEACLKEACQIEFTIDNGQLDIFDCVPERLANFLSPRAAVFTAVDLVERGYITKEKAICSIDPRILDGILHPTIDPSANRDVLATGLAASPGAATGKLVFSPEAASVLNQRDEPAILARIETSPEDIQGIRHSTGVLTIRGGMTSHAAVVARGLGKPCVAGATQARIDHEEKKLYAADGRIFVEGSTITIDGSAGQALVGDPPMIKPVLDGAFGILMQWADEKRRLKVRANADTPEDARMARGFMADGVGLCRTEHMFFETDRILTMRQMIMADSEEDRRLALDRLAPDQRDDFIELFKIMRGLPVTIRLLDPPLHEFLPNSESELKSLAEAMGESVDKIIRRADDLREFNPMLGKRGCRLGVAFPEIYEMQARAIFEAAIVSAKATDDPIIPEIMIPLVSAHREVEMLKARIDAVAIQIARQHDTVLNYQVGIMVETPRAALRAEDLAQDAEFFSFGTNDLTQMTYGLSRDDAGRFMGEYISKGVFYEDPFHTLDQEGVGELILLAAERGQISRPDIGLGMCGEHAGDADSVAFCERAHFDYVSCSPYRVPVARLAAAQAALNT